LADAKEGEMSSNQPQWTDPSTAEQLLACRSVTADAVGSLTAVLRAATAPTHPEELVREEMTSAAFVDAAQLATANPPRRPSMLKTTLAKILTVKAAIIFATVGSTGVVLAAGATGALPQPWSDTPASPPATSRSANPPAPPSITPTGRPSDAGTPADEAPAPSMTGLCQAYEEQVKEAPGKALDSSAFSALITAAGSADKVPTYCDSLTTTTRPSGKPSDLPTPTAPGSDAHGVSPTVPSKPHTPASSAPATDPRGGATTPPQGS
jgi:hypothetical protein